jgi:hypothetical protein
MGLVAAIEDIDVREDGFGARRIEIDPEAGRVEVLSLAAELSTPGAEQAIRARAAALSNARLSGVMPIVAISRGAQGLSVSSAAADGVTLADLLAALEFRTIKLADEALLELAGDVVRAVAAVHAAGAVHGALAPAHVIVRRTGGAALSGAVFGDALQALQWNRERLWRSFGVALPPSASLPRFDHRADVTQLGALVIAILLRRPLAAGEYPRCAADLVNSATAGICGSAVSGSALRMWLQQVLQLHPKAMFASAVDAAHVFTAASASVPNRRAAAQAVHAAVRQLCGGGSPVEPPVIAPSPALTPVMMPVPPAAVLAPPPPAAPRRFTLLRNVFPALRAN